MIMFRYLTLPNYDISLCFSIHVSKGTWLVCIISANIMSSFVTTALNFFSDYYFMISLQCLSIFSLSLKSLIDCEYSFILYSFRGLFLGSSLMNSRSIRDWQAKITSTSERPISSIFFSLGFRMIGVRFITLNETLLEALPVSTMIRIPTIKASDFFNLRLSLRFVSRLSSSEGGPSGESSNSLALPLIKLAILPEACKSFLMV